MQKISKSELRKLCLSAQGLLSRSIKFNSALDVIKHLGYIQIDTISVCQRAHHHVIFTRFAEYQPEMLSSLQQENRVFEYWTHAASFLPISSFKYTLRRKKNFCWHNRITDSAEFQKLLPVVLRRITEEGGLSAKDFSDKPLFPNEPWNWKLSRYVLEYLFQKGKLMVAGRNKFQKVYDLTERVYPESNQIEAPSNEEAAEFQILSAVRAMGAVTLKDIFSYLCFATEEEITKSGQCLLESGRIIEVESDGEKYFITNEDRYEGDFPEKVYIISPFDNLIINRNRLERIFDINYRLECYLPKTKRKFGFFSMPLLFRDKFIGLIDLKADRKKKNLVINKLLFFQKTNKLERLVEKSLEDFTLFNQCITWSYKSTVKTRYSEKNII